VKVGQDYTFLTGNGVVTGRSTRWSLAVEHDATTHESWCGSPALANSKAIFVHVGADPSAHANVGIVLSFFLGTTLIPGSSEIGSYTDKLKNLPVVSSLMGYQTEASIVSSSQGNQEAFDRKMNEITKGKGWDINIGGKKYRCDAWTGEVSKATNAKSRSHQQYITKRDDTVDYLLASNPDLDLRRELTWRDKEALFHGVVPPGLFSDRGGNGVWFPDDTEKDDFWNESYVLKTTKTLNKPIPPESGKKRFLPESKRDREEEETVPSDHKVTKTFDSIMGTAPLSSDSSGGPPPAAPNGGYDLQAHNKFAAKKAMIDVDANIRQLKDLAERFGAVSLRKGNTKASPEEREAMRQDPDIIKIRAAISDLDKRTIAVRNEFVKAHPAIQAAMDNSKATQSAAAHKLLVEEDPVTRAEYQKAQKDAARLSAEILNKECPDPFELERRRLATELNRLEAKYMRLTGMVPEAGKLQRLPLWSKVFLILHEGVDNCDPMDAVLNDLRDPLVKLSYLMDMLDTHLGRFIASSYNLFHGSQDGKITFMRIKNDGVQVLLQPDETTCTCPECYAAMELLASRHSKPATYMKPESNFLSPIPGAIAGSINWPPAGASGEQRLHQSIAKVSFRSESAAPLSNQTQPNVTSQSQMLESGRNSPITSGQTTSPSPLYLIPSAFRPPGGARQIDLSQAIWSPQLKAYVIPAVNTTLTDDSETIKSRLKDVARSSKKPQKNSSLPQLQDTPSV
jgi:hypothetical protein